MSVETQFSQTYHSTQSRPLEQRLQGGGGGVHILVTNMYLCLNLIISGTRGHGRGGSNRQNSQGWHHTGGNGVWEMERK